MNSIRVPKNVLGGALLLVVAGILGWQASQLRFGTTMQMGPGYFPIVLCGLLGAMGLIILISGLRVQDYHFGRVAWRGLVVVTAAILVFAFGIRGLGFVPATALMVLIVSFASRKATWKSALLMTVGLTAFSWATFIKGIGLPLPLIGPWLGGW